MDSRLSAESLPAIYDSGCSGLAFDRSAFESKIFWNRVDFHQILMSSDPAQALSDVSAQALYYSLLERGPGECLEVLSLINTEQFLSILDYDVWRRDQFVPERVLYWVDLLRKISPEKAYEQFRNLEEEYQLATLSPFIKIYDQEAYEQMTDVDQDRLQRLPGDALFYSIETQDQELAESVAGLINSVMACDMNYALSLVAHAAYLPQNESAQTAGQFRLARLEEDGFVTYDESLTCFQELDPVAYKAKLALTAKPSVIAYDQDSRDLFLDQVLKQVHIPEGLASLANNLCAASQLEPDDLNGLKFVFTNGKALCSLALEYLSEGDLDLAAKILVDKYPKDLFRVGLGLVRVHQKELLAKMCELDVPGSDKFKKYFYQQSYALMLDWLDKHMVETIGFELCEVLKGFFNRFPQIPNEVKVEGEPTRISFFPISKLVDLKIFEEISNRMALCFQRKFHS